MVRQAEQDRVRQLLIETLPTLCRSGLSCASEVCVEALVGITLNKNDVFLVSIKETVREASLDGNVVRISQDDLLRSKGKRKRKRTKQSKRVESESDVEELNDEEQIKRGKSSSDTEEGAADVSLDQSDSEVADVPQQYHDFSDESEVERSLQQHAYEYGQQGDAQAEVYLQENRPDIGIHSSHSSDINIKQEPSVISRLECEGVNMDQSSPAHSAPDRSQYSQNPSAVGTSAQSPLMTSSHSSRVAGSSHPATADEGGLNMAVLEDANAMNIDETATVQAQHGANPYHHSASNARGNASNTHGNASNTHGNASNTHDSASHTHDSASNAHHTASNTKSTRQSLQCASCPYSTTRKSNLVRHQQQHTGLKYQCDTCDSLYASKSVLLQHYRLVHGAPLVCECCSKAFTSHSGLALHLKRQRGEFLYTCGLCGKGFIEKGNYEGHMSKHAKLSPYACECGKSYRYKCSYVSHKKACKGPVDPNVRKEIRCEFCEKIFNTKYSLKEHLIAKHSTKSFKCDRCCETFQWRPSYTRHVKSCNK